MFDTMIIGQVCRDTNTDFDGTVERRPGGAVLYSGHAAAAIGGNVAVVPKGNPADLDMRACFDDVSGVTVFPRLSARTTEMVNTYFTADRERRKSICAAVIDPYTPEDLPDEPAKIYHIAGLVTGDISDDLIRECAKRGDVAVDVQCMMRRVEPDQTLKLHDWDAKYELLPLIRYLKTDAAEAEKLTGTDDRERAARLLHLWGAKEVVITHNTEVIAFDGETIYREPLRPRNLSGRTGRGDTTFAGYLIERLTKPIPEALAFASALVSLKMETPGPFLGTRDDVLAFRKEFY